MLTVDSHHGIDRLTMVFMRPQHQNIIFRRLCSALVFVAAAAVAGCVDPASLVLSGASVVTFAHSGKTVTDHAMSMATDQDCSLRHTLDGDPWCLPISTNTASVPPAADVYCYRSIAAVTCYRQLNPHDTRTRRMKAPMTAGKAPPAEAPEPAEHTDIATK
jgi:hypothetical protein